MNEKAQRLKFKLYGLPENWFNEDFGDTSISKPEADRLKTAFSVVRKGSVCYVQGTAGPVVNQYINKGVKVRGVDMMEYLDDPFDKEEKKPLPKADVVCLYNCTGSTTQVALQQKIFKKIQMHYKDSMIIYCGDVTGRAFSKEFIPVKSFCNIPEKKEEAWL